MSEDHLKDQIEELVMLQRVDQELGATLDFDNVLGLTMDWALRRTGAVAGMYCTLTPDGTGLIPLIALGYPPGAVPFTADAPCPITRGVAGKVVRTGQPQIISDGKTESGESVPPEEYRPLLRYTRSEIAVPIEIGGSLIAVVNLEADQPEVFSQSDLAFLKRLSSRAAIAIDHARLYRRAEEQADDMAALYSASRLISSSLERPEALANGAQSIATVLRVSSVIILEYQPDRGELTIANAYRLPTAGNAPDVLPTLGDRLHVGDVPEILAAIKTPPQTCSVTASASTLSAPLRAFMEQHAYRSMLIIPLTVPLTAQQQESEILGVALAAEGRRERRFTSDECEMADALGGQVGSAIRQASLYEDVRELETLKSEMIRMAAHDLRNPLNNVMGYFDLFMGLIKKGKPVTDDHEYVGYVRQSFLAMKTLLEDMLTLEKVESERRVSWAELNFSQLVSDIVENLRPNALLKQHTLTLTAENNELFVFGSIVQLRQAVSNLVENAMKYTPENGQIQVRLKFKERRLTLEVQDNGYGISKERQARLFHRFYRAHQPGTDHIQGTGLGLSLVKTVIERHGGEVWVQSEAGIGSIFSMWLPLSSSIRDLLKRGGE